MLGAQSFFFPKISREMKNVRHAGPLLNEGDEILVFLLRKHRILFMT